MLASAGVAGACALLVLVSTAAQSQVYKCTVDGKTVYQGVPCEGGKKLELPAAATPTPDQSGSSYGDYLKREAARLKRKEHLDSLAREGKVAIGMDAETVESAWGPPTNVNRSVSAGVVSEQWVYRRGRIGYDQYVYLRNGIVTSIESTGER